MQFRKQTDLKVLCLYVADPATFLASNSVLVTSFHSENNLFIQLLKKKIWFFIMTTLMLKVSKILSLNFFTKNYTVLL